MNSKSKINNLKLNHKSNPKSKIQNSKSLIESDILGYLKQHENKELLRFITCGSVDDGKSTLIGRLLYETKMVFEDHLMALKAEAKYKRTEDEIDFSLLVDGLQAEREQGITIDVAYRYFSTEKKKYIIADTPGHEQYTRNMVTGASNADLAVILIDARNGVLTQTKRHTFISLLLGINHVIVAVNKMDLVDYSKEIFEKIQRDYLLLLDELKQQEFFHLMNNKSIITKFIPISALKGDNIVNKSVNMPWYKGETLLEYLDNIKINNTKLKRESLRFPVQYVNRPNPDFRGYCGWIASGEIKVGDEVLILPSRIQTKIKAIIPAEYQETKNATSKIQNLKSAEAPMPITILTEDKVDIGKGDLIVKASEKPQLHDSFKVFIVWMSEEPLRLNKTYNVKIATTTLLGYVESLDFKIDVNTLKTIKTNTLNLNEIAVGKVVFDRSIMCDKYTENKTTGGFIIIDRVTNNTVGVGLVIDKVENKHVIWHKHKVEKSERVRIKGHKPAMIWLTGLSGSGKSTIANELELRLNRMGIHTYILDGDNIRHGLNKDLGFSVEDRNENIRRIAEVGKLFVEAGIIVISAFISPFRAERNMARNIIGNEEFIEVFVDAPLDVCEKRDPKELYKKARKGEIKEFTGIDSPYEIPEKPEIHIRTDLLTIEESVEKILRFIKDKKIV